MSKLKKLTTEKSFSFLVLIKLLRFLALRILQKYQPQVIGITGSIGKTSAKEAVAWVLAEKLTLRKNDKNYNNETGLLLTIIGAKSGGRSLRGWLKAFAYGLWIIVFPVRYPKILILEMGADRPGDIEYLTSFVQCQIGVVTEVAQSHMEFFGSLENIAKEKEELVRSLGDKGLAILNADNPLVLAMAENLKSAVVTFGFSEKADLRATDIAFNYSEKEEIQGLSFKLNFRGTSIPVRLNNILAKHQIYSALIATAVAEELGMNLVEISAYLADFFLPPGRLNLMAGIKKTFIIDDTYNASPDSCMAALEVLREIKADRKIAVLGDMLELGAETEKSHRQIGRKIAEIKADLIFFLGTRIQFAAEELKKHNFNPANIFHFENHADLGRKLQAEMREGDLVLIKGSQAMRMEKIVEEIMADPQDAEKLLCRQDPEWKKKEFKLV
ncbi:UDP-N-acetylmuramoyl-tripeptide--D-alanyl-D-alanine ligase [Patescibacteria group bacterium]|nr:UDP-N-acetylmuramoyl-tripeptide--D-alanyl-D-alanine ligase [Patescibacteria group bacterium]